MSMLASFQAALARLLVRGILQATDDDGALTFQRLTVRGLHGEVFPDVQFLQPYGLTSNPEDGAQVALFEVGGARDHVVALLISDERNRPKDLPKGDAALHGKGYIAVHAKSNGDVVIEGGSDSPVITVDSLANVTVDGGVVLLKGGAVVIDGSIVVSIASPIVSITGHTTIEGKVFLAHTHSGVTPGGGSTGPVV